MYGRTYTANCTDLYLALHAQIPLQYTKSIGDDESKLKWPDKNIKRERGECEIPGKIKEVWDYVSELQRFLCYLTFFFSVLKGHPGCIAHESVYSTGYKLLSETFGTNIFPKMRNGLKPKRNLGIWSSSFLHNSEYPWLYEHRLVSNVWEKAYQILTQKIDFY